MFTAQITLTATTRNGLVSALDDARASLITGDSPFERRDPEHSCSMRIDEQSDQLVCISCGKNPGHNDIAEDCYECGRVWSAEVCEQCREPFEEADIDGGRCLTCGHRIDAIVPSAPSS